MLTKMLVPMSELTPTKGPPEPGTKQEEVEVARQQYEPDEPESSPKPDGGADMTLTQIVIHLCILS